MIVVKFVPPEGDLFGKLKEQKGVPLEERQVVEWFVQIAMALQVHLLCYYYIAVWPQMVLQ